MSRVLSAGKEAAGVNDVLARPVGPFIPSLGLSTCWGGFAFTGGATSRRGSVGADGDDALMKEYQDFVAGQFKAQRDTGTPGTPGEVFQNRNADHAKVVIPFLFRGADQWVHLLTARADRDVYGSDSVKAAAIGFLESHPEGRIAFLSEEKFDRAGHPLFQVIDQNPTFAARVSLEFVPDDMKRGYACNFAVNDHNDFRFEPSRNNQEAMVQFGGADFAPDLERTFADLRSAASA